MFKIKNLISFKFLALLLSRVTLFILIVILFTSTLSFGAHEDNDINNVSQITQSTLTTKDIEQTIKLPYTVNDFEPRELITLNFNLPLDCKDYLYIKSDSLPFNLYVDDKLILEHGKDGTYADFMINPGNMAEIISLPENPTGSERKLKIDFFTPVSVSSFTISPMYIGSETSILRKLLSDMFLITFFSGIQIIGGLLILLASIIILITERKGIALFWFGLFVISFGAWSIGSCDLSYLFIKNSSFLTAFKYTGFFFMIIAFINFVVNAINLKHDVILKSLSFILSIYFSVIILLQAFSICPFSKFSYSFYLIIPATMLICSCFTLYEAITQENKYAKRFSAPLISLTVFCFLELANYKANYVFSSSLFFHIGMSLFIVASAIICAFFIKDSIINQKAKEKLQSEINIINYQIEASKKTQNLQIAHEKILRHQRHDLRHHLVYIKTSVQEKKDNQAIEYINGLISHIPTGSEEKYCENIAVNSIISHFAGIAKSNDIKLDIRIVVPEYNTISDSDLCVVFANLFENAIEACQRMKHGDTFITIKSDFANDYFLITVDNSFDGNYKLTPKGYLSKKRNDIGTGTSSIATIAQNHNGEVIFEQDNRVWKSSFYIKN